MFGKEGTKHGFHRLRPSFDARAGIAIDCRNVVANLHRWVHTERAVGLDRLDAHAVNGVRDIKTQWLALGERHLDKERPWDILYDDPNRRAHRGG